MILVTGATGTIGSEVVKQLVAAGQKVRVLARNPAKAEKFSGVETVAGDMLKPETLPGALAGVDKIFLLATSTELPHMEANVIDAAKKAGVKHIVKLSVMGADFEPGIPFGQWHRAGEKKLEASGIAWTFLRPTGFASNDLDWANTIKPQGAVYNPTAEGTNGTIDPRDIAEVAVVALTQPGHEGKIYTLTGPESLSTKQRVEKIAAASGRKINVIDVTLDQAKQGMLQGGMPAGYVDALIKYLEIVRANYAGATTEDVQKVLGRKPRSYDTWVKDNVAAFK